MRVPVKHLDEARKLVAGKRGDQHGDFITLHERIAELWTVFLKTEISPEQVAFCMVLLKLARKEVGAKNDDHLVDAVAYAGIWSDLASHKLEKS